MKINVKTSYSVRTHEGAPAVSHVSAENNLRRSVMSCLLWENGFYESGEEIAARIVKLAAEVPMHTLASIAVEARSKFHMRHVPLLLLCVLAKHGRGSHIVSDTIAATIQRADELAEFVSVYAKFNNVAPSAVKKKLSAQVKKGLAKAFLKFSPYQLAKYNRDGDVKLRDVMFLAHPKPTGEMVETLKLLAANTLPAPETWEVLLSAQADKKETFERLIREGKLGYLALLRNLRGMTEAGVDSQLVRDAILARKGASRVLPFRYVAAARACPQFEREIDTALLYTIAEMPSLPGTTAVLVDVSGSMDDKLSSKSDMKRIDAAAALASMINGSVRMFTFSNSFVEVPPRRGMAGVDAIINSQFHSGTLLGAAIETLNRGATYDRLIVITDEQSKDRVPAPTASRAYMINVASNRNGVGYGPSWVHIDGFSESVLRFIYEYEGIGSNLSED